MADTQYGKYKITARLGAGATADVFQAWDTELNRWVALKFLKPALMADRASFERFRKEASTAANLFHDNIATVLDMGEQGGYFYIAMKFIEGVSLDKAIRQKPLTWNQTLKLAAQIGSALDFAHSKGFLHRDVKPNNIMLTPDGNFVLTDFGLAHAAQNSGLTSTTGIILGTPAYVPPEIWNGAQPTPAADQYALACVLVEALTGRAAFGGETPQAILAKHLVSGPDLPSTWPSGVPGGASQVLARALDKDPYRRFRSCNQLLTALTHAPTYPVPGQPFQQTNYKPAPKPGGIGRWAAGILLLAVLAGLGYFGLPLLGIALPGRSPAGTGTPSAAAALLPSPSAQKAATSVPPTATSAPSQTPLPSATPAPSFTPQPTQTPLPTETFTPTPKPVQNFTDTFDTGIKPEWTSAPENTWITSNGRLVALDKSLSTDPQLWIGNETWQNYTVELDVITIPNVYSDSVCVLEVAYTEKNKEGFQVRISAANQNYKIVWPQIPNTELAGTKFPYTIRITLQGNLITTYVNGKQVNQANMPTFDKGYFRINCNSEGSTFDNFKISPLP